MNKSSKISAIMNKSSKKSIKNKSITIWHSLLAITLAQKFQHALVKASEFHGIINSP